MKTKKQNRTTALGVSAKMKVSPLLLLMAMLVPQMMWAWGGSGTASAPYTISSAADLLKFANIVNGTNGETKNINACGKLTADITLIGTWTPIGNSAGHYRGTFDGQGHTISGFSMEGYTKVNSGLFGYVEGAIIKGFTLNGRMSSSTQITSGDNDCSGTVVGYAIGSSVIQDIVSNVNWTLTSKAQKHLGGIVGQMAGSTTVSGCTYLGTLDAGVSTDCIGGIVGFAAASCSGSITNCFFDGTLQSSGTSGLTMGGILGYTNDEDKNFGGVQNCYSCGTFTFSGSNTYVNAIVGRIRNRATTTVNNTYLTGTASRAFNTDGPSIPTSNKAITISVTAGTGGNVTQSYVNPTSTAATLLHVDATGAEGYHYANWNDSGAKAHDVALTADITRTATFGAHTYGNWITDVAANCTTSGTKHRVCTWEGCDASENGILPAVGHGQTDGYAPTYSWSDDINAHTCSFTLKCKDCNTNVVSNQSLTGTQTAHSDASCMVAGSSTYRVTGKYNVSGSKTYSESDSKTYTIAPLGHSYTSQTAIDTYLKSGATCTEDAQYFYKCSRCDDKGSTYWNKTGSMLRHDMTEHVALDATCTVDGNILYYTCSRSCCEGRYYKDNGEHTTDAYADQDATVIAAIGHDMTEYPYVAATCLADGHEAYYTCSHACCSDRYFKDADGTTVWRKRPTLPALPHHWDEDQICTLCGRVAGIVHSGTCGTCTWSINEAGLMIIKPATGESGTLAEWKKNEAPWFEHREEIKSVKFQGEVIASTCNTMFYGCTNLETIDFSGFNTANVKIMSGMFFECRSLVELDLSSFDTSGVTEMKGMFSSCSNLQTVNLKSFNTTNVESMVSMFARCHSLRTLDLSSFDTSSVVDMGSMFPQCNPETLDLSNFDTSNVKNMSYMFDNSKIKTLKLNNDFVREGCIISNMFYNCSAYVYYILDPSVCRMMFERGSAKSIHFVNSALIKDGEPFRMRWENGNSAINAEIVFTRTFTPGEPTTIMLPCSGQADNLTNAKFYGLTSLQFNPATDKWEANMNPVEEGYVEAYTPYMVLPMAESLSLGDQDTYWGFPQTPTELNNTTRGGWTYVALNETKTWAKDDPELGRAYLVAEDSNRNADDSESLKVELVKVEAGTTLKAGRCYFLMNERGDVNLDGSVDVADVITLINILGGLTPDTGNADIDGHDGVTQADVVLLREMILGMEDSE